MNQQSSVTSQKTSASQQHLVFLKEFPSSYPPILSACRRGLFTLLLCSDQDCFSEQSYGFWKSSRIIREPESRHALPEFATETRSPFFKLATREGAKFMRNLVTAEYTLSLLAASEVRMRFDALASPAGALHVRTFDNNSLWFSK